MSLAATVATVATTATATANHQACSRSMSCSAEFIKPEPPPFYPYYPGERVAAGGRAISSLPDCTLGSRRQGRPIKTTGRIPRGTKCLECGKSFNNSSALAKHKLTHSDERKYICMICSKAFKRQDHLNGHMMTHRSKKPFQCQFSNCDKSYCDARSLRRHLENHHQEQMNLLTAYAGNAKFQQLKREVEEQPPSSPSLRLKNPAWNQIIASSEQLSTFSIDGPKPFKCEKCEKRFKNMAALNGHMRLHGGYVKKEEKKIQEEEIRKRVSSPLLMSDECPEFTALQNAIMDQEKEVKEECIPKVTSLEDIKVSQQQHHLEAVSQGMLAQYQLPFGGRTTVDYSNHHQFTAGDVQTSQQHSNSYSDHPQNQQPLNYSDHLNTFSNQNTPQAQATQVFQFNNIMSQQEQEHYNQLASPVSHTTSSLPNTPCSVTGSTQTSQPLTPNHVHVMVSQQSPEHCSMVSRKDFSNQHLAKHPELRTDHHIINTSRLEESSNLDLNSLNYRHQVDSISSHLHNNHSLSNGMTATNLSSITSHQMQSNQMMQIMPTHHPLTPHPATPSHPLTPHSLTPSHPLTPHPPTPSHTLPQTPVHQLTPHTPAMAAPELNSTHRNMNTSFSFPPLQNSEFGPLEYDDPSEISTPLTADDIIDAATAPLQQDSQQGFQSQSLLDVEDSLECIKLSDPPFTLQPPPPPKRSRFTNKIKSSLDDKPSSEGWYSTTSLPKEATGTGDDFPYRSQETKSYSGNVSSISPDVAESQFRRQSDEKNKPAQKIEGAKSVIGRSTLHNFLSVPEHKHKNRPDPLIISAPNTSSFLSQLRSPRLHELANLERQSRTSAPPYTPPPMLSPVRSGSGLFCSLTYKPLTPKASHVFNAIGKSGSLTEPILEGEEGNEKKKNLTEEKRKDSESAPETDIQPHVNIGKKYQAEIPQLLVSHQALKEPSHEQLLWHPETIQNLREEDVQHYQDFACTAAIPGNGMNKEYALHLLHQSKGNITSAILQLMKGNPLLAAAHSLMQYKYQESDAWSNEEIHIYQMALLKYDKDFLQISKQVGSKSVKECIQFYYLWKKVCCDDYKKLRLHRRRNENKVANC